MRVLEQYRDMGQLAGDLVAGLGAMAGEPSYEVPVVARSRNSLRNLTEAFHHTITSSEVPNRSDTFFWGRVPIDRLVRYFRGRHEISERDEYLDLGTPLQFAATTRTPIEAACDAFLIGACVGPTKVGVMFVDRGDASPGQSPDNFGGKLHHLSTSSVTMSDHAMKVFRTLLERLDHHSLLPDVELACELVTPPASAIGLACFDHANSVEMLAAVTQAATYMSRWPHPVVLNLSMGTHVGPHNGESPLETYLRSTFAGRARSGCFGFVAAGNDGRKGVYSHCALSANVRDYVTLRTGAMGTQELLVELWWDNSSADLDAEVDIVTATGAPLISGRMQISATSASPVLARPFGAPAVPAPVPFAVRQSLYAARCSGTMSCLAFTVSVPFAKDLASATITIALESNLDVVVNGWIVVCSDPSAAFVGGAAGGTLCVPGTVDELVSVLGVDTAGRPWRDSSQGPPCDYGTGSHHLPQVAHLAELTASSEWGTSYASPRAAADAAAVLADPALRASCTSVDRLLDAMLGTPRRWQHPRLGFGSLTP